VISSRRLHTKSKRDWSSDVCSSDLDFTDGTSLRYNDVRKFGRMQLVKTGMEMQTAGLAKLGPEPKEETFIVEDFSKNLKRRKKAIKNALLDQTIVAGLGNI